MTKNTPPPLYLKLAVIAAFSMAVILFGYSLFLKYGISIPTVESAGSVSLVAIFLTGLLTGGLTCMAVQGGLLAATITQQTEASLKAKTKKTDTVSPILSFLGAKIIAYTLLGLLFGWFGSFFTLSLSMQAFLQIVVAIFLLGTAANMLSLHPIFRYFVLQPPRFVLRIIRKHSKRNDLFAPVTLGAFTVFIPCGTTQAMMALAIASGNPLLGATILAAFTIGTSPVFFLLGYFTTKLSSVLHARFIRFAAVVIAVLALFNLNNALALTGIQVRLPFSKSAVNISQTITRDSMTISILDTGYTPASFTVKRGSTVTLKLTNDGAYGCASAFAIPYYNYQKIIRVGQTDSLTVTMPNEPMEIPFMCSMGMYRGVIYVI